VARLKRDKEVISFKIMLGRNMRPKVWMHDKATFNALTKVKKEARKAPLIRFDRDGNEIPLEK